ELVSQPETVLFYPSQKVAEQRQLTIIGVANDAGENVGLIPGIACNKFPPWMNYASQIITLFPERVLEMPDFD
ncbi:unnamed protein product, partial [Dovyalis caffra]